MMDDLMKDKPGDPRAAIRERQLKDAVIASMSYPMGRRLIFAILRQAGKNQQPFTGNRETTDFNCGQLNVGIWLETLVDTYCPQHYLTMIKEAKEDENDNGTDDPDQHARELNAADSVATITGGSPGK